MRSVVADSGPILAFARAGQFPLLAKIVPSVFIPDAVYAEVVTAGAGRPGASEGASGTWATRRAVANLASFHGLSPGLDPGEEEATALARELGAPLLIDDPAGRKEAHRLGIAT